MVIAIVTGLPYVVAAMSIQRILLVLVGGLVLVAVGTTAAYAEVPDEAGLFNPEQGQWMLGAGAPPFFYGNPGDTPFMGDWNGDGVDTPGLFRRSDGFVYLRNWNGIGNANVSYFFGNPSDVPLVGDFNGDGLDTVSIYRPAEQRIYISNSVGPNGGSLGAADFSYLYGNPIDTPFVGDFDGDGIDTVGLHRRSTGEVFLKNSHTSGSADVVMVFGDPADIYIAGDWDGDGVDSPGAFRPSSGYFYERNTNSSGNADNAYYLGTSSWLPIAGDWAPPPGFTVGSKDHTLVARFHVERDTDDGIEKYVRRMQYWPRAFRKGLDIEPDTDYEDYVTSAGQYAGWDVLSPSTNWEFKNLGPRNNWMHFTLNRPATVAVVWRDNEAAPSWLDGWASGGTVIVDGDIAPVFKKSFPAGPVSLGSVEYKANWRDMYLILVAEQNGSPTQAPPVPPGNQVTPGSGCPTWVHDFYTTTGPDGRTYQTWHPQVDPVYWCYFGHEHGSNPDLIPGSPKIPYGYVAAKVPQNEPDAGFKEFIFRDMTGKNWVRFIVHANTASRRRVCAQFHTLYVMVYDTNGKERFSAGFKNNYGAAVATSDGGSGVLDPTNCGYSMPTLAQQVDDQQNRRINVGAGSDNYETWDSREESAATIGLGMVEFDHRFDVRNPMSHCTSIVCNTVAVRDPEHENATRRTIQMASWRGDFTIDADHALGQGEYFTNPFVTAKVSSGSRNAVRQYVEPGFRLSFDKNATANRIQCVATDPWTFDYVCYQIGGAGNVEHVPHVPNMMIEQALWFN